MAHKTPEGFTSKLADARGRFLASVVEHAVACGRRSAADFLRAFPARAIMTALGAEPQLRAKLLIATTGQDERIATKKSAQSAGEDLELALSEGVAKEDAVLALLDPDDRVRFLDHGRLWGFVTEGEFWRVTAAETPAVVRDHVAFILERARAEKLLSARDVVEGVGVEALVEALPEEQLARLLGAALAEGRNGKAFDDDRALDVVSVARLLEHVSLAHVWENVVAKKLSYGAMTDDGQRVSVDLVVDDDVAVVANAEVERAPSINVPGVVAGAARAMETGAMDVDGMLSQLRGPLPRESVNERITVVSEPPRKSPSVRR